MKQQLLRTKILQHVLSCYYYIQNDSVLTLVITTLHYILLRLETFQLSHKNDASCWNKKVFSLLHKQVCCNEKKSESMPKYIVMYKVDAHHSFNC